MAQDKDFGLFLPTTATFDRSIIETLDVNSPEFKDFLVRLYQSTNNISIALNLKTTGYYVEKEYVDGNSWFPNKALTSMTPESPVYRQERRTVFDFGALPNGTVSTTKTVAHGIAIDGNITIVRCYGHATKTSAPYASVPLPNPSPTLANNISIATDATNIIVTVDATVDWSSYDTTYIILEYIRQ